MEWIHILWRITNTKLSFRTIWVMDKLHDDSWTFAFILLFLCIRYNKWIFHILFKVLSNLEGRAIFYSVYGWINRMAKKFPKDHMAIKLILTTALHPHRLGSTIIAIQTLINPHAHANLLSQGICQLLNIQDRSD